jgi:hypothetical protein
VVDIAVHRYRSLPERPRCAGASVRLPTVNHWWCAVASDKMSFAEEDLYNIVMPDAMSGGVAEA